MGRAISGMSDDNAGVVRWRRELVAFAAARLGADAAAAEDIVQDAYEHLMRRAIADAPPDHVRAWLFAVVRSRCRDERERRRHTPLDLVTEVEAPGPRPDDTVIAAAASRWMVEQIDALPVAERTAVVATLLGDPARGSRGTANARHQALFRARRRLRHAYEGAWAGVVVPVALLGRTLRRLAMHGHAAATSVKGASLAVRVAVAGGAAAVVSAPVVVPAVVHSASGGGGSPQAVARPEPAYPSTAPGPEDGSRGRVGRVTASAPARARIITAGIATAHVVTGTDRTTAGADRAPGADGAAAGDPSGGTATDTAASTETSAAQPAEAQTTDTATTPSGSAPPATDGAMGTSTSDAPSGG